MTSKGSDETSTIPKKERIAKFLARAGVASRRACEELIAAGRVRVNGAILTHPATLVDATDAIADPEGRPTVFDALREKLPRVISVGRLDINSEGLLLLTNDGELARYLEHPGQGLARTYRVRAHGRIDSSIIARLRRGLTIDRVQYRPIAATIDSHQGANCWLTMVLDEGKNREIKRLLEYLGLRVTRLIRTGYGPFAIGKLQRGAVEEVPTRTLRELLPGYFTRTIAPRQTRLKDA